MRIARPRLIPSSLAWVACLWFLSPAAATYLPASGERLHEARQLEQAGRWLDACVLYERVFRENRSLADAREGYQRCLRHVHQSRRHRDRTFTETLLSRKPNEALDVYEEVLTKLQTYYQDRERASLTVLFRQGLEELRYALEDDTFLKKHLAGVRADAVRAFREQLEAWRGRSVHELSDARRLVLEVAALAGRAPLRLPAAVVVLEFACGACNALDEYTVYLTPGDFREIQASLRGDFVGIGIDLAVEDGKLYAVQVVPNSPAALAGLRPQDRILGIDRKQVEDVSAEVAAGRLRGAVGTVVELEVLSPGEELARTVRLLRQPVHVPSVIDLTLEEGVGYFRLVGFQETTLQEVKEAIMRLQTLGMKALILDLRGNPGGLFHVSLEVAELFIGDGVLVRTRSRLADLNRTHYAQNASPLIFPLVVLVDGDTSSSAEVLAGALKERRGATLIGQTTFGKGSLQRVLPLDTIPAGLRITVAQFYSPANFPYTGYGVSPTIPVAPEVGLDAARNLAWQHAQELALMLR